MPQRKTDKYTETFPWDAATSGGVLASVDLGRAGFTAFAASCGIRSPARADVKLPAQPH